MSIHQFITLRLADMVEATNYGTFLTQIAVNNEMKLLYYLDNFFVEVIYDLKLCVVSKIRAFNSVENINDYLDCVDISDLYRL